MKRSRLKKDKNIEENIIKKLKKENKAIKYRILRDISNLFEYETADYYKPVRVNNLWNNDYIEYKSR